LWIWSIGTLIYFIIVKPWWIGAYALGYHIIIGSIIGLPGIIIVDGIAGKILGRHPKYYALEIFYSRFDISDSESLFEKDVKVPNVKISADPIINKNIKTEKDKEEDIYKVFDIDKVKIIKLIKEILKENPVLKANDLRNQLIKKLGENITATKFSFIIKEMNELKQLKYNEDGLVQPNTKIYYIKNQTKPVNNLLIICKYCYKKLPSNAIYCRYCGKKIKEI
jgi:hypothetical protein